MVDGLLAGLGGVVIFVPQIALLFGAVAALEESGYMTRVAFMNDRWLRALGLDGRSAIPCLGGFACAIPAILGARTIPGKRERLLTILITPWMTCSAQAAGLPLPHWLCGALPAMGARRTAQPPRASSSLASTPQGSLPDWPWRGP